MYANSTKWLNHKTFVNQCIYDSVQLTWRHVSMWLRLCAKWTSLLTILVICPMFPARGVCFPAAGTVGWKITQDEWIGSSILNVSVEMEHFELHIGSSPSPLECFLFLINSIKYKENQDNLISITAMTMTTSNLSVWSIQVPDFCRKRERNVYLLG